MCDQYICQMNEWILLDWIALEFYSINIVSILDECGFSYCTIICVCVCVLHLKSIYWDSDTYSICNKYFEQLS